MIYNIVFIDGKAITEFLNFVSEEDFFEKLWEWTYLDNLWDFIEEDKPDKERLISYIDNIFIDDEIFHNFEDDDLTCFAFVVHDNGRVSTYNWNQSLEDFVLKKIEKKYGKSL